MASPLAPLSGEEVGACSTVRIRCRGIAPSAACAPCLSLDVEACTSKEAECSIGGETTEVLDAQQWLCMWCSLVNLGGEVCANRRCLRDRSLAGVDPSATRKRAAPVRLGTSPTAQPGPRKARAVGAGRSRTPLKVDSSSSSRRKSSPPCSPTSPKTEDEDSAKRPWLEELPSFAPQAAKAAIHLAVAALRQGRPLKAEPLSPRTAMRLTESCQFADLLKVEQRSGTDSSPSSPLARSSTLAKDVPPSYTLTPALSQTREGPSCALAPKLAFKQQLRNTAVPLADANHYTWPMSRCASHETTP